MALLCVVDGPLQGSCYAIDEHPLQVGRDPALCSIIIPDLSASRVHFRLYVVSGGLLQIEDCNSTNGTFVNGERLLQPQIITSHDRVEVNRVHFRFQLEHSICNSTYPPTFSGDESYSRMVPIGKTSIYIGRDPGNDVILNHPMVSRRHARIDYQNGRYYISDLGSSNGTFINGSRINRATQLEPGTLIGVGSFSYRFDGFQLAEKDHTNGQVRIRVKQLGKVIQTSSGVQKQILSNINLVIEPREFVAVLGSSGAGKTTLVAALTGMSPASYGQILINGVDFYANYDAFRALMAYVPQDDIVHQDLTVKEVLYYAARLRMPDDSSPDEIAAIVNTVIGELELDLQSNQLVKSLSGGQRKRVSIGVELITRPSLFFLDEPTSGLDPGLEKTMMELMRKLANQGRTIFCITHATFNIHLCDKVLFLARDGNLAFYGTPQEALDYFKARDFAEIYQRINNEASPEQWAWAYLQSPYYNLHIGLKMSDQDAGQVNLNAIAGSGRIDSRHSAIRQWWVLTQRYAHLMIRDWRNLLILILQAVIIPFVVMGIFYEDQPLFRPNQFAMAHMRNQSNAPAASIQVNSDIVNQQTKATVARNESEAKRRFYATFVVSFIVLAAIWLGAMNAAREIVKEDAIYKRERLVGLQLAPYILSKVAVLSLIGFIQSVLYIFFIKLGLGVPEFWLTILAFFLISLSSILMGLTISAVVSNEEKAMSVLPLILMPQMLLSGMVVPFDEVKIPFIQWLYYLVISKWGYELIGGSICQLNDLFALENRLAALDGSFSLHWWVLIYFIVFFYVTTTLTLLLKDRKTV